MNPIGHPNLSPAATKLFTVAAARASRGPAAPPMNNFG
jgi:hypothetical protein